VPPTSEAKPYATTEPVDIRHPGLRRVAYRLAVGVVWRG
jgi:hypothetical protein